MKETLTPLESPENPFEHGVDMRIAAYMLAIDRVAYVIKLRVFYA
jgi:hypothetical protein